MPFINETETKTLENAYLNYKLILHDRSFGIHNPGYIERLLDDSIAAISDIDDCEAEFDLDEDCDVDKDDSKLLKARQKEEKTALKDQHKAEKEALKAAKGSSDDCEAEFDLDEDCDVDKDDSKLLKARQKEEKTDLKDQHKAEKETSRLPCSDESRENKRE